MTASDTPVLLYGTPMVPLAALTAARARIAELERVAQTLEREKNDEACRRDTITRERDEGRARIAADEAKLNDTKDRFAASLAREEAARARIEQLEVAARQAVGELACLLSMRPVREACNLLQRVVDAALASGSPGAGESGTVRDETRPAPGWEGHGEWYVRHPQTARSSQETWIIYDREHKSSAEPGAQREGADPLASGGGDDDRTRAEAPFAPGNADSSESTATSEPPTPGEPDEDRSESTEPQATVEQLNAQTSDMLSLVLKNPPSADEIAKRTVQERIEAENWAALLHINANDHDDVPVPEMPAWLKPCADSSESTTRSEKESHGEDVEERCPGRCVERDAQRADAPETARTSATAGDDARGERLRSAGARGVPQGGQDGSRQQGASDGGLSEPPDGYSVCLHDDGRWSASVVCVLEDGSEHHMMFCANSGNARHGAREQAVLLCHAHRDRILASERRLREAAEREREEFRRAGVAWRADFIKEREAHEKTSERLAAAERRAEVAEAQLNASERVVCLARAQAFKDVLQQMDRHLATPLGHATLREWVERQASIATGRAEE